MDFNNMNEDWKKEAPKLAEIEKQNPFTVPEDYFESLKANIEAEIISEELKDTIKHDGFLVPKHYFENLSKSIHNKTLNQTASGHPIRVKKLNHVWVRYAAAASVTIGVSVAIFLNIEKNNIEKQLNTIPDTEIVQYLQISADASDTPLIIENLESNLDLMDLNTDVSQEEIEQYINSTTL